MAPDPSISVLYVDDDPALLDLTEQFLESENDALAVTTAQGARAALDLLDERSFDAVVSDYQMPEMDGLELLRTLREERDSDVPFIVFTGRGREEVAVEALNLGADRYLQKGGDPTAQYGVLVQAIEQEVEHHRTRTALERREQNLRITLESIGDAVIATDETGAIERMNGVAEDLTGWDREDAVGRPLPEVFDIASQETGEPMESPVEEVLEHGRTVGLANGTVLRARDGEERVIADSASPITDEDEVVGVVLIFRDVTETYRKRDRRRRQREAVVDLSTHEAVVEGRVDEAAAFIDETMTEVLEAGRSSVWLFDDDRETMTCLDLYERDDDAHGSGMTLSAEAYPNYFEALVTHRSIAAADAAADPRTAGLTESYLEPEGIESMLDATVRRGGEVVGVLCAETVGDYREWTEDERRFAGELADQFVLALTNRTRRRRETELRRKTRNARALFEQSPTAVLELSPDLEIRRWNDRASTLFGYDADEAVGRHVGALVPDADEAEVTASWTDRVPRDEPTSFVRRSVTADGTVCRFEWHVQTVVGDDGDPRSVLAFVTPVDDA
ncbi:PAS domain S-box protein [Haloparvum sedimenti]|uniref:PAS domain S-box protein n=1 Tax=Haloparvum sedimenti TaxID=1678448 RepID=UPI00071E933A|nr:PAS domain S-box protein [Haloparvum sedimenti]